VNNEFQNKIDELSVINDDMMNLLNSSNIATIFLDNALQIKRYTPDATRIFNLIGTDVGRPLGHLMSTLNRDASGAERWMKVDCLVEKETGELRLTLVDITERRKVEKELRQLAEGLIQLQEKERRTVAEALHGDAGQQLTYLAIILDQARESGAGLDHQKVDALSDVTRGILQRIRTLSASLSPAELSRVSLAEAVKSMIAEFTARTGIPVSFMTAGRVSNLGFDLSLAAYRIVQEALTNAARHAQAANIEVSLESTAGRLVVVVADNGKGFSIKGARASLGLPSMRERARSVGGNLVINSSPGKGTRVTFEHTRGGEKGRRRSFGLGAASKDSLESVRDLPTPLPPQRFAP
jgi:signal transduction histidine kinase